MASSCRVLDSSMDPGTIANMLPTQTYLAPGSHVLGGKHGCVGRRLIAICLDLHAASDAHDGFLARQISNVYESVVEGGEDVSDAEHQLALAGGGAQADILLSRSSLLGFGCHF